MASLNAIVHDIGLVLLVSVGLAAILAPLLLLRIRRSVTRMMRLRAQGGVSTVILPPVERAEASPLHLSSDAAPDEPSGEAARALFARTRRARRRAATVYFLAGVTAACVLAVADALAGNRSGLAPVALLLNHSWPAILTVSAVAVPSFRIKAIGLTVTVLVLISATWAMVANPEDSFIAQMGPPTLLLLLLANRWLKTITLVLALWTVVAVGAFALSRAVFTSLDGTLAYVASLGTFLTLAALGMLVVRHLVRAYDRKEFSDLSFYLAFLWTVFSLWFVATRGPSHIRWAGFIALVLYAVITRFALPMLPRAAREHSPANLLVLRVFGAPGRSQRLLEEVGTRWRYVGPLHLIAGTDSAIANLDLSEAYGYLTFRFRSLYVSDLEDLDRRLAALDCAPDPDGRYRVNDFFCFADTWKKTFTNLLRLSDAVLIDLSGFGPQNMGVAFELTHLLGVRPLESLVLITDERTDMEFLSATLARIWRQMNPALPNAKLEHPVLRVLHKPRSRNLVAALCDAAVAGGWRDKPGVRVAQGSSRFLRVLWG